jgi:hypothetical protein
LAAFEGESEHLAAEGVRHIHRRLVISNPPVGIIAGPKLRRLRGPLTKRALSAVYVLTRAEPSVRTDPDRF